MTLIPYDPDSSQNDRLGSNEMDFNEIQAELNYRQAKVGSPNILDAGRVRVVRQQVWFADHCGMFKSGCFIGLHKVAWIIDRS